MNPERRTPTVERKAIPLRLVALAVAVLAAASPAEAFLQPSGEPGHEPLAGRNAHDQWASDEAYRAQEAAGARAASWIPHHRSKLASSVPDDGHVLQEANGSVAEHPGYRRYHYGYGPLSVVDTNGKRFIQTDALGSPTDLTTTGGAIASIRKYDAWGSYRDATAPGSGDEKLGYTGHQYDPETGLVYARARYYDPEVGAFISRDRFEGRIFEAPSLHRYLYAQGNPLAFVDPDGNESVKDALNRKASESAQANEEGWMTFFNATHAAWDFVDAFTFGTMAKLDTIEDAVTAGDARYKGGLGEANYVEDVLGTASVGILKVAVAAGVAGAASEAVTPAATAVGRFAQGAATGALAMGSADFAGQAAENTLGTRKGYDVGEFATATIAGGLAGAGGAAVAEAARTTTPAVQRTLSAAGDELRALRPVARVVEKMQETVQAARSVAREAWRDAATPWAGPRPGTASAVPTTPAGAADPVGFAQSLQGTGAYPGIDRYRPVVLREGTLVAGGAPGQSNFYTTLRSVARSGGTQEGMAEGLQVAPHPAKGYRPGVSVYRVRNDTQAAIGKVRANPQYGPGGFSQIVIDDYDSALEELYSIPLRSR